MPHVGVKRLGPGDREHDRAEQREALQRRAHQDAQPVIGIEREKNVGLARDLEGTEQGDGDEPHHHDRTEIAADPRRADGLHHEQDDENDDGQRDDERVEERRRDLQSLDCAQHRDCRRDHAVAIEQRRAEETGREQPPVELGARARHAQRERGQRQDAAFAAVIRPHDDADIFQRHDGEQRPGDQRQHAVDRGRGHPAEGFEALFDGVKRRGADITVDNAERTDH